LRLRFRLAVAVVSVFDVLTLVSGFG